jgi:hypothetical protein
MITMNNQANLRPQHLRALAVPPKGATSIVGMAGATAISGKILAIDTGRRKVATRFSKARKSLELRMM